jgi:hypothetical protein
MSTSTLIRAVNVPSSTRSNSRTVWIAVAVAFALRFGWVLLAHSYRFSRPDHFDFGQEIGAIASSLATGNGFSSPFLEWSGPTTWVAPVYPFLLAAVFKIFGVYSTASALVILGFNCACSALTCWPIWKIAERITNRRVAQLAIWLWALLPPFMAWSVFWVWDAALTTLVLTWIVWLTIRLSNEVTLRQWLGFGVLWGIAALLNPSLLSVLPFTIAYIAWKSRVRGERWLAPALLCCSVVVLTITPWLIRNYFAFGQFVFIRGNFWAEMRYGNSAYGDGTWMSFTHPENNAYERQKLLQLGELKYFDRKKQDTLEFIRTYPWYFRELCFRRVLLYWWDFQDLNGDTPDVLRAIARRTFSTMALLGVVFLWIRRREGAFLLSAVLVVFPVPYYLTYPYGRYRHVLEPLLLICALYCVAQLKEFKTYFATDLTD